jgi:pimeloyl-ACP methyl ester carboxylesterase
MPSPPAHPASRRAAVALVAAVLALAACTSGASGRKATGTSSTSAGIAQSGASGTPRLSWHDCDSGQCATLSAPLDYANPTGPQLQLALFRRKARRPAQRLGSLLMNPGGPGASGVELVRNLPFGFPTQLRDRFDIVGWDPRGTGISTAVDCGNRLDYLFAPDISPETAAAEQSLESASKQFADACASRSGPLLPYLSSKATVRDMDRIRDALGEKKLTYLGYSYGTYLGALYANMFPDRVRALVLDGAVDPSLPARDVTIQQAQGFERALDAFLVQCADDRLCEFHSNGQPRAAYDALSSAIDVNPLPARVDGNARSLGPTQFELGVSTALYGGRAAWPQLAGALAQASRDDGTDLLRFFDLYVNRSADGTYADEYPAFLAIGCLDGPSLGDLATVREVEAAARAAAPHFGAGNVGLSMPCTFWPVPPNAAPSALAAPGAPPIVVVGTTGDPATPVAWAQGLAAQLGSGRLLMHRGEGHTAFPAGDECLDPAIVRYLVDTVPPANGTVC